MPIILIHTSVKLVTLLEFSYTHVEMILIHTSVKLVTKNVDIAVYGLSNFNPHEREARDQGKKRRSLRLKILIHTSVKLVTAS